MVRYTFTMEQIVVTTYDIEVPDDVDEVSDYIRSHLDEADEVSRFEDDCDPDTLTII